MRQEQFTGFLAQRGGCAEQSACAADIERRLGLSLDNADLSAIGIQDLLRRLVAADPGIEIGPYRAALEAYGDFSAYFKAR